MAEEQTTTTPDEGKNTGTTGTGPDNPGEKQSIEFSSEQQKTLQNIVDKTMAKGVERGQSELLTALGITQDEIPGLKDVIAAAKANGNGAGTEETTEEPNATKPKGSKAQQEADEWRTRFETLQSQTQATQAELQAQVKKQYDIAVEKAMDSVLSTEMARFNFAESVVVDEVRDVLRKGLRVDDNLNVFAADDSGNQRLNARGENMTVQEFVSGEINKRNYLLAARGGGAGSQSVESSAPGNQPLIDIDWGNYRPGTIREALNANPEALDKLIQVVQPTADVNPFAQARLQQAKE